MKLKPGVTVYHGGKVYKGEIPDDLTHLVPEEPKKEKRIKKSDA